MDSLLRTKANIHCFLTFCTHLVLIFFDLSNQISVFIESWSPILPGIFGYFISIFNVLKFPESLSESGFPVFLLLSLLELLFLEPLSSSELLVLELPELLLLSLPELLLSFELSLLPELLELPELPDELDELLEEEDEPPRRAR